VPAARFYNPPPNWPPPPDGWQPPDGWEPNFAWGPAPDEGCRLFERVNPHPFLWSWAIALGLFAVVIAAFAATVGINAFRSGEIFTRVAFLPALATGLLMRTRQVRWPLWKTGAVVLLMAGAASLIGILGSSSD